MGDRRRRQSAEKQRKQAKANLGRVIDEGNRKINDAERNEATAEKHLDRMRMGYSEGAKLYYDMYKTLATLTTGSILVIVALSRASYHPTRTTASCSGSPISACSYPCWPR